MQSLPHYEELPPGELSQGSSSETGAGHEGSIEGGGNATPQPRTLDPIPGDARLQRRDPTSKQLVTSSSHTGRAQPATTVRQWQDITGEFETTGRLLWVRNDIARIAKTGGTTTTVSLKNLSEQDRQYIDQFVASTH